MAFPVTWACALGCRRKRSERKDEGTRREEDGG